MSQGSNFFRIIVVGRKRSILSLGITITMCSPLGRERRLWSYKRFLLPLDCESHLRFLLPSLDDFLFFPRPMVTALSSYLLPGCNEKIGTLMAGGIHREKRILDLTVNISLSASMIMWTSGRTRTQGRILSLTTIIRGTTFWRRWCWIPRLDAFWTPVTTVPSWVFLRYRN